MRRLSPGLALLLSVLLLTAALPALVVAQRPPASPVRPGWLPAEQQFPPDVTAADRNTMMGVLRRVEQILLQVPALAAPDGFEIVPQFAGGYRLLGPGDVQLPNGLIRYNVGLMMFAPSRAIAGEGRVCVSVIVNDNPPPEAHRGAGGFQIIVDGERGQPVPYATETYGGLPEAADERGGLGVRFVAAGPLPLRQVTREELINTLLFEVEGRTSEVQTAFAKTPYQEWMDGAADRKREREETLTQLRGVLPAAEIEKTRQQLEASERDTTERLRKADADAGSRAEGARTSMGGLGDSLRATLKQMTPADRARPVYVNNALTEGPMALGYRLTNDAAPPSLRMLTPNWDFYRAGGNRLEVRSVGVTIASGGTCLNPKVRPALRQAAQKLDWGALNALLVRSR